VLAVGLQAAELGAIVMLTLIAVSLVLMTTELLGPAGSADCGRH
jgi:hypothetical protein